MTPSVFKDLRLAFAVQLQTTKNAVRTGASVTLRIQKGPNGRVVVFKLIGRIEAEHVAELQRLFESEGEDHSIVLELQDVTLVDREAVKYLAQCEANHIKLENCPQYVREWIARENARRSE